MTQEIHTGNDLKDRQAVAFVHRDKAHTHVHAYVNRIGFDGKHTRQLYRKTKPSSG